MPSDGESSNSDDMVAALMGDVESGASRMRFEKHVQSRYRSAPMHVCYAGRCSESGPFGSNCMPEDGEARQDAVSP